MFDRILVPVDLTDKNAAAVARALALASPGAEIVLLHVIERIEDDAAELEAFYRRLEGRARAGLDGLAARVARSGRRARTEVVVGRRVEEIVEAAARLACDLVVLTSHTIERGAPGRDWLTISYRVALLAPCSVLLVRSRKPPSRARSPRRAGARPPR
ncbi:MAG: UspA domain protein [Acidobacteria bacterium]|nr:UspA domain protein [Acidobacteriota bacterium]